MEFLVVLYQWRGSTRIYWTGHIVTHSMLCCCCCLPRIPDEDEKLNLFAPREAEAKLRIEIENEKESKQCRHSIIHFYYSFSFFNYWVGERELDFSNCFAELNLITNVIREQWIQGKWRASLAPVDWIIIFLF